MCLFFDKKTSYVFKFFSIIFPSYTDKCLVLMNSIIIPLTSVFYFVFSSYTNKCLVIRISGIVIPKSLILLDAAFKADQNNISFKKIHRKILKKYKRNKKLYIVLKIEKCTEFHFATVNYFEQKKKNIFKFKSDEKK